jgi:hypothetical protein
MTSTSSSSTVGSGGHRIMPRRARPARGREAKTESFQQFDLPQGLAYDRPVMPLRPRRSRRPGGVAFAGALLCAAASLAASLQTPPPSREDRKPDKPEQAQRQEFLALVRLADSAIAGGAAPADFALGWQNDFLKAQGSKTYVPFTLTVDAAKIAAPSVLLYVRAVSRGAAVKAAGKEVKDAKDAAYAVDEAYVVDLKTPPAGQALRISRAFGVPPGEYDVYIVLRERPAGSAARQPAPKAAVLKHTLSVPDYWTGELTTSTVILADAVEPLEEPLQPHQQMESPYTLGTLRILPAADRVFEKNGAFTFVFQIYNSGVTAEGKPDLEAEYKVFHRTAEGEKYFNVIEPQKFNASTQGPQFDLRAGHQVTGAMSVPLESFPQGDFRLEITVNDRLTGKRVTRDVRFTVVGS